MKKIKEFIDKICKSLDGISKNIENNTNKLDELNDRLDKYGIANLKINGNSTISCCIDRLDEELKDRPNETRSVDLINREIDYREGLEKLNSMNPEILEFINLILNSCNNLDKYQILDKAYKYSEQYIISRR